jgi:hypothetical protein
MVRYKKLLDLIKVYEPRTIAEIGAWNGENAKRMISQASEISENVEYIGYDLFEEATSETDAEEFNVKKHFSEAEVYANIKGTCPDAEVALIKGNTRETLRSICADFVWLDGGHSVETIESDYEACKHSKVIVFDDYYVADEQGRMPDINKVGCNRVVEKLPHTVIETRDPVSGGGYINIAVVGGVR